MPNKNPYKDPDEPVGKVAELFAGVGGFRLGLNAANWKTVFSNQWEPATKSQQASEVYVRRFGEKGHTNVDIAKIDKIPSHVNLLVGGFPCQDYSVAKTLNSSKGIEGKKGVLWWEILRLVKNKPPKYIFLENVDRLLKSPSGQRGRDFAIMLKTLGEVGYLIEWRVASAADYGFPQRRIRVFIVASRIHKKSVDFKEILFEKGVLARALPIQKQSLEESEVELSSAVETISSSFNLGGAKSPFLNSGVYYRGKAYSAKVQPKYLGPKQVLGDILIPEAEVPDGFRIPPSQVSAWKKLKDAKTIERRPKNGTKKYFYSEGKMAFPDLLENPSRTIITGEGGSSPSRFKHIIRTDAGYRRLTPRELERLSGFPEDHTRFDLTGNEVSDIRRAFFMGNALVVGMITKVGIVLAADLAASRKKKE